MNTIDCGFTSDVDAEIFFRMWVNLFIQHMRETKYMAEMGGHDFSIEFLDDCFGFSFHGYNEGFKDYYKKVFGEMKNFKPDQQYFNDLLARQIRIFKNSLLAEPYMRSPSLTLNVLSNKSFTVQDRIDSFGQFDLAKFNKYQALWL